MAQKQFGNNMYNVDSKGVPYGAPIPIQTSQVLSPRNQPQGGQTQSGQPIDLTKFGISPDIIKQLGPSAQAYFGMGGEYLTNNMATSGVKTAINRNTFDQAVQYAQSNPEIMTRYGDQLKLDMADVQSNLALAQTNYDVRAANQAIQFAQQKTNLAEKGAETGASYSGFQNKAKENLATEQSGIIRSQQAEQRAAIQKAGSALESTYGTQGLSRFGNIGYGGQSYNPIGGIQGSQVRGEAGELYGLTNPNALYQGNVNLK